MSDFAKNWSNKEFAKFVEDLRALVDDLEADSEIQERMKQAWNRVIELEIEFWPTDGEQLH